MLFSFVSSFISILQLIPVSSQFVLDNDLIIETTTGLVRGLITKTRSGRDIYTFYGIRYAEPPTGLNRFKPPIPARRRNGIANATAQIYTCHQKKLTPGLIQSEDCLFLDVYSNHLRENKPVIVFIHGGAFQFDDTSDFGPEYLLDKNVVLVSINYRLDGFGYFSVGRKYASGNQGLKDQNLAMKWVRDNIKFFGGNPELITLSGQSAGAFSISLHMLAPISFGLFHRVIAMSGSAMGYVESVTRSSSQFLLEKANCNRNNLRKSVECLQNVPAEIIIEISKNLTVFLPWYYDIENEFDDMPFITEHPVDMARQGKFHKVPIIAGVTKDEFFYTAYQILYQQPEQLQIINQQYSEVFPTLFMFNENPKKTEISLKLYSFYLKNQTIQTNNINVFGEIISDVIIGHGVHRLMEYARRVTNVYYYLMDFQGRYSKFYYPDGRPLGVLHEDDLQYMFRYRKLPQKINKNDLENPVIRITSWWAQFAATGNPNDKTNKWTNDVVWKPCTREVIRSMYINKTCRVGMEHYGKRYAFLDTLFPLY